MVDRGKELSGFAAHFILNMYSTCTFSFFQKIYGARGRREHINFGMTEDNEREHQLEQNEDEAERQFHQGYLTVTVDTERRNSIC